MAGVTLTGWQGRTLDELYERIREKLRTHIPGGADLTIIPESWLGGIAAVMAEELGDVWDAGGAMWFAFIRDFAQGEALDNIGALTGTERLQAEPSTVVLALTGDAGTVIPTGRTVSVEQTGVRVTTTEPATLIAAPAWAQATVYAEGLRVTTSNPSAQVYRCILGGASAGGGTGPSGTGSLIIDGTARWAHLGEGSAHGNAKAACTVTGPVAIAAGTLTQKDTPVAGWRSVTNPLDAEPGRNRETDADYRIRQVSELRGLGNSSVGAIREKQSDEDLVAGVITVNVFENDTDTTNADGMPPHSVEVLVQGGEDQVIREVLYATKAAGIKTHGAVVGTVTDSEGGTHTVRFSRPGLLTVHVAGTVQLTPDAPSDDDEVKAQLAAAVVLYGDGLSIGRDVVTKKVEAQLTNISWVHDVSGVVIGLAADTLGTANIPVTTRQRADLDSSRCTFTLQRLTAAQL